MTVSAARPDCRHVSRARAILTGDQHFFIGSAQFWRTLMREDAPRQQVMTDPHSPGEYRTNGVLRNIPEFYAAFNVQPGDKMYLAPEQRVRIW